MIPTDPAPPPPLPPQPPRSSFSCDKHPDEQFNGFCPSCLCERLVVLDQSSSSNNNATNHSSSSRRPSTSSSSAVAASIKSLFTSSSNTTSKPSASAVPAPVVPPKPLRPTPFFPELRRTKSFCASKHEPFGLNFSGAFEPQRKSCDVRLRNSLWTLFTQDDESKITSSSKAASTSTANQHPRPIETNDSCVSRPVLESKEEDEEEIHTESDEIAPVVEEPSVEIVQEDEEVQDLGTMKPMKDHIDTDAQVFKKASGGGVNFKEIAGSLLSATSVFSKKWQKWRQKQKQRKQDNRLNSSTLSIEKPISRHYRETQSEIADYGFGRRSCDTDPRFSLDAGRISFDDPRYSLDEPRASWDGYFMNGRSFPRMIPPMLSVVEDAPVVTVARTDAFIPVEEPPSLPMDDFIPGGSAQTNEYYSDSSSRRRKSLDRSSSIRKTAAAVVAEMDEMKAISNGNVLPNTSNASLQGIRDTNSNGISKDYYNYPENFHLGGFRNHHGSVIQNREAANGTKLSRRWRWKLWGFIRSSRNKDEDEDEAASNSRGVARSYSESWQDLRRNGNGGNGNGGILLRSNSSVSWRHSNNVGVGVLSSSSGNVRKLGIDINGGGYNNNNNTRKKKGDDQCVLERNRSARYSPNNNNNNTDNGLLRFYLTPMRNSRRNRSRRGVAATKKQA